VTSLAGLPLYLELVQSSGLAAAIRQHVQVVGRQGWLDIQMVLAVIFLNLADGDCLADLERLEQDSGFAAVLQAIERDLLSRGERRLLASRWRRERERTVPSPAALSAWLERFHGPAVPKAVAGTAFIPAVTEAVQGMCRANQALLDFMLRHQPAAVATLDMDATLIETHKRDALHCSKGFKAYQPLNCWWAEQGAMLYSEFRNGSCPPGTSRWLRARCGESEEVHSVMKSDLAGGQMPSGLIGANAAWWALMLMAHNLNTAMKRLVLGKEWTTKRMKALRLRLIGLPGRVVRHARTLIIRLGAGAEALATIVNARQTIRALACGPAG
jgi:hypothetical protein